MTTTILAADIRPGDVVLGRLDGARGSSRDTVLSVEVGTTKAGQDLDRLAVTVSSQHGDHKSTVRTWRRPTDRLVLISRSAPTQQEDPTA